MERLINVIGIQQEFPYNVSMRGQETVFQGMILWKNPLKLKLILSDIINIYISLLLFNYSILDNIKIAEDRWVNNSTTHIWTIFIKKEYLYISH